MELPISYIQSISFLPKYSEISYILQKLKELCIPFHVVFTRVFSSSVQVLVYNREL